MLLKKEVIAKKYAQALLSLYYQDADEKNILDLMIIEDFFKKNKKISVFLSIPGIAELDKEKALEKILTLLNADTAIKKMAHSLLKKRRIELFDKVIHHIIRQLRCRKKILLFTITSSHQLAPETAKKIINMLSKKTNAKIEADFILDKNLISGIRIKSDFFLWERSLNRLLQCIKLPFTQRARS